MWWRVVRHDDYHHSHRRGNLKSYIVVRHVTECAVNRRNGGSILKTETEGWFPTPEIGRSGTALTNVDKAEEGQEIIVKGQFKCVTGKGSSNRYRAVRHESSLRKVGSSWPQWWAEKKACGSLRTKCYTWWTKTRLPIVNKYLWWIWDKTLIPEIKQQMRYFSFDSNGIILQHWPPRNQTVNGA
jgi:hypothetical protein